MKKILFISVLGCFLFSCQPQTPAVDQQATSQTEVVSKEDLNALRYLKEVEWPKAYREQDTILLDRILGEDFQMIDASGNWTDKSAELAWIKENASAPDSFYYDIKRLDALENGTVLICGTGHIFNDTTHTVYQSSNILIKRNSTWKAVASHVSGVKPFQD